MWWPHVGRKHQRSWVLLLALWVVRGGAEYSGEVSFCAGKVGPCTVVRNEGAREVEKGCLASLSQARAKLSGCGVGERWRPYNSTHSLATAGVFRVTIRVNDVYARPITGAWVWVDPGDPRAVQTGSNGVAEVELLTLKTNLIVVRHAKFGRAQPLFAYVHGTTNFQVTLPWRQDCRIATYNLNGYYPWSTAQRTSLARVLWTVQPDIILAQESRTNELSLADFCTRYLRGYYYAQSPEGGPIRNGLIACFPLTNVVSAGAAVMTRDVYSARVLSEELEDARVCCVHFKAYKGEAEAAIRDAEAQFTAAYCSSAVARGELVILGGDMNEDIADPTWLSHVHSILASGIPGVMRLDATDDAGSPVTYPSWGSRLDYLYVSTNVHELIVTGRVFRTDTMLQRPPWLAWNESMIASDHTLVYADITVVPEPALAASLFAGAVLVQTLRRRGALRSLGVTRKA
ncbi:MAG: endonuclease/exonuclease/phosphatase family protein [bacterium]|nr:endonuclease/exonuclease/phosphatase family protein [bacterium]